MCFVVVQIAILKLKKFGDCEIHTSGLEYE